MDDRDDPSRRSSPHRCAPCPSGGAPRAGRELAQARAFTTPTPTTTGSGSREQQRWSQPWTSVRSGELGDFRYFEGGTINVADNCVDRWAEDPATADRAAIVWEGEPGDTRTVTYAELADESNRLAARPARPRRRERRRRRGLHAQPRRGVHRDPRLQPHRRDLHGAVLGLRRGRRGLAAEPRGRRSSSWPTRSTGAASPSRCWRPCAPRAAGRPDGRARRRRRPHRRRRPAARTASSPTPTCSARHPEGTAGRAARPERAGVPDLHQRHRVAAEGRRALGRRVPARHLGQRRTGRSVPPTATSTGWPPTSAG